MIKSINIKQFASYDENGIQINNLKKINFIYGANGCGKTTISNFLFDNSNDNFKHCTLNWNNEQNIPTLVYNKQFREQNFGSGQISGIFTLGEATAEEIENIRLKNEELKTIKQVGLLKKETLEKQTASIQTLETKFKDDTWSKVYKKHEKDFKEAFVGFLKSESFKNKLLEEYKNNKVPVESIEELKLKAKTILGEIPQNITLISLISFDRVIEIEKSLIWKKIIVGKADVDISKLIQKLNINDWVNVGRNYIENDTCPFCQKETITIDFKKQLESYFDETYLEDLNLINSLKQEYFGLIDNVLNELNLIEVNQKNFTKSKLDNDKFSAFLKTLASQISTNKELINNKTKEPSRIIEIVSLKEQLRLISELIIEANKLIGNHNKIVTNFAEEKKKLINSIWRYVCEENKIDIDTFLKSSQGIQSYIDKLKIERETKLNEFKTLDAEIKLLAKNVTSIQPTIDEINKTLKSYGFLNFEIVPSKEIGFYQIQREDGTIAESTLSEGEITFITFLYYLQLAKGGSSEDNVNSERILVIDDPISSLDSNVLFLVSTLIKEIIKEVRVDIGNIKQIILLTHNIYFHKEVTYVDSSYRKGEKAHFWILRKNNKHSTIQPYLDKNPIQSSYELLWREIKEWEKNSGITIQNTMRRIIENYYSILGNRRDDFLLSKFTSKEEKEICRSLMSWTNEGSHTMPDDLYIESPDNTISKYLDVFREIFVHTENIGHYNMMMEIEEE
ncbi:AAA family ATPase [Flavobacterium sp. UBA4854]|uniref:AAA family ATPase n=1 Tax=Flavobacterium sp. UBA4854 TaxID=1946548 RepID=UPI00257EB6F5|nr:AAA family ATPase [Flavobacterium sp. UBA4854]